MKILFVSLGCDKNLVDTEEMIGLLGDNGYELTNDEMQADIIIINTCCFIDDAKKESINTIIEMSEYKVNGTCKSLIVTGCLAQRYKDEILTEIPEIDAIVGTTSIDKIVDAVKASLSDGEKYFMDQPDRLPVVKADRVSVTGGWYEYLKIAEGCDKKCTYCIIPKIRGRYRSYPMDYLLARARDLVAAGTKEIILVAQEVTMYGTDLPGKHKMLTRLIKGLAGIRGLEWIRLLYCYPEEITDDLIFLLQNEPKLCKYIDMPIQHASDAVLKYMGRKTDKKHIEKIIKKLRDKVPDICIRTTFISGFPGETAYDHETLKEFIKYNELDRVGIFTYSAEEGTPAAKFPGQIPDDLKEKRRGELMELQQAVSEKIQKRFVGKTMTAIIDGFIPEDDVYVARTYRDAPDVDGNIFINPGPDTSRDMVSGTFVKVKVTGSTEYDLIGDIVE